MTPVILYMKIVKQIKRSLNTAVLLCAGSFLCLILCQFKG